jgi:deazaflavin-dependent oxidoreductase (nitroreductase family)
VLLLHTTGAKSGAERINPLVALVEGDRMFVFASKAGAPAHPDWYRNLKANPAVTVEVGTEHYPAAAVEVEGAERDRIWQRQMDTVPTFAEYEEKAGGRVIPVIELVRAG